MKIYSLAIIAALFATIHAETTDKQASTPKPANEKKSI